MPNLFSTLVIAFVIIVFAIAFLAIGWLIKGKTRIVKASDCDPDLKKDGSCQTCEETPTRNSSSPNFNDQQRPPSSHT